MVNVWTYIWINWFALPYVRAWAAKYSHEGLVVVGVLTPEFSFERKVDNVGRALRELRIDYPVAIDNDYAVWTSFDNHYWPARYFADGEGLVRHHHFGEGEYERSEMVIQRLLAGDGSAGADHELVSVGALSAEAPADWANLRSPENYTGYGRTENTASPGGAVLERPHTYAAPAGLEAQSLGLVGELDDRRKRRDAERCQRADPLSFACWRSACRHGAGGAWHVRAISSACRRTIARSSSLIRSLIAPSRNPMTESFFIRLGVVRKRASSIRESADDGLSPRAPEQLCGDEALR